MSQTDDQSLDAIEKNIIKLEHQVANQSVQLATNHYGEGRSEVATQRGNLAVMYSKTGQYSQATIQYEHALRVTKKRFGEQHPNVTKLYNNMAGPLKSQKRYDEAQAYGKANYSLIYNTHILR